MGGSPAVPFGDVLREELRQIEESRRERGESHRRVEPDGPPEERACHSQLLGLAFSGGGIRSATFNLGVLQGLADLGLLSKFDYLSTVSGGGYIGTWLAAWIQRRASPSPAQGLQAVADGLKTDRRERTAEDESREIKFLRDYSNYLTPRRGLFSGDTWAFVGSYLRNLVLNQTVLVLALIAVILLPRPLVRYFWLMADPGRQNQTWLWVAAFLLTFALAWIIANLSHLVGTKRTHGAKYARPLWVYLFVVVFMLAGGWFLWAWVWSTRNTVLKQTDGATLCFYAGAILAGLWAWAWAAGAFARWLIAEARDAPPQGRGSQQQAQQAGVPQRWETLKQTANVGFNIGQVIFWAAVVGMAGGALLLGLVHWLGEWSQSCTTAPEWHFAYWGVPLVILVFLFVQTLHIGLVGDKFPEDAREWWGRLGGTLTLWTLYSTALFALAIDGPWLLKWLQTHGWIKWGLTSVWGAITGAGVLAGKNPATGPRDSKVSLELIGKIAPPVFVVGLLFILASFTSQVLPDVIKKLDQGQFSKPIAEKIHSKLGRWPTHVVESREEYAIEPGDELWGRSFDPYWGKLEGTLDGRLWICILILGATAWLLSWRIGINTFSAHALYRNRLVRCYLGASNLSRNPQKFTGFDPDDDNVPLESLTIQNKDAPYVGPYPIINTALNLVSGEKLAWQQRKASSFVLTPLFCGYDRSSQDGSPSGKPVEQAYARTENSGFPITLGTAMAISGAAASPNMGYHSSPALAFLMTVFNARLGWWMGNPRYERAWRKPRPGAGLFYLFCELFGATDDRRAFVYLSDGGHFENLAIYELVRRRCRFIVVCDAEEDHELKFGGLGNAIEKCRTDFGVDIELNVAPLRPAGPESGLSQWHCAVGTIRYDKANPGFPTGTLIYLKASLTGDEPTDVQRYKSQHPGFPHQSTADQWFDEPQFESYRALGHHIVQSVFGALGTREELQRNPVENLFVQLRQRWYPPSVAVGKAFTKHTATYSRLLEKMVSDPNLRFLDPQVYPEWPKVVEGSAHEPASGELWLPSTYEERRAGFYFCNQLIQLMEDVYIDLHLEEEYDHPDNRGWMNLFRHWAWSGMFVAAWVVSASTYGARFQKFCERHLDLRLGRVEVDLEAPGLLLTEDAVERDIVLRRLGQSQPLNFWEVELTGAFLEWGHRPEDQAPGFALQIVPFEMVVPSLLRDGRELRFVFGFALVRIVGSNPQKAEIWYFRIQDHLRKMGLARAALSALMRRYAYQVENRVEEAPERLAKEFDMLAGQTSLREAVPTAEAVQTFKQIFDSVKLSCWPRS